MKTLILILVLATALQAKTMLFRVTGYCPCEKCCGKWSLYQTTADGHKIQAGDKFIAAPKEIAFGTKMYVPGYGYAKVKDRGGAIKNNRLDVYFPTHREALIWGVRYLKVEVY